MSRRIKYLGIAPTANEKLGREARRGDHDLRKLVGHANFLDLLAESLDDNVEEEARTKRPPSPSPVSNRGREEFDELEDSDSGSSHDDSDSDDWSDESDDQDHALIRTTSKQQLVAQSNSVREAIEEAGDDYFVQSRHGEAKLKVTDGEGLSLVDVKKDAVTIFSQMVEVTPPVSPSGSSDGREEVALAA